jgi:hypothetical protein
MGGNVRRRWLARASFIGLALWGCRHPAPPPPTAPIPEPLRIPVGCEANLSGGWLLEANPSYQYWGEDLGGTLRLVVQHVGADAGVSLVLARTPHGFVGQTVATGFTSTGHPCPVTFPTEVRGCPDGGLVLSAAASTAINDECQSPQRGPTPPHLDHVLIRPPPPAPDAGLDAAQDPSPQSVKSSP